jgi:hypothetical protein
MLDKNEIMILIKKPLQRRGLVISVTGFGNYIVQILFVLVSFSGKHSL